jgi:predicted MFS family arabinose efflux permease
LAQRLSARPARSTPASASTRSSSGTGPERPAAAALATFTGFFEVGLATAAIVLGAVLDELGFAGLYGVAAGVSAAALVPLAMARAGERRRLLAEV